MPVVHSKLCVQACVEISECKGIWTTAYTTDDPPMVFRVEIDREKGLILARLFFECMCARGLHFRQTGHQPGVVVSPKIGQMNME